MSARFFQKNRKKHLTKSDSWRIISLVKGNGVFGSAGSKALFFFCKKVRRFQFDISKGKGVFRFTEGAFILVDEKENGYEDGI